MAKSAPDDLNKYIDFSNRQGMDNQDSTVKNYADELLANAIRNNPSETAQYFGNPNNQQSIISDGVFARAVDVLGTEEDLSSDSLRAVNTLARKDPLATLDSPELSPRMREEIDNITDDAFTDAAKYYSPTELSEKLNRLPEGKVGLITQMLEKSIDAHPEALKTQKDIEDFEANLKGLKIKFPALADALDSLDVQHPSSDCKGQQVTPNNNGVENTVVTPTLLQDPLAATGLKWQYKQDGTAILDIADIANSSEQVKKMLERIDRNSISNFSVISDQDTQRHQIILTPQGVKDLYDKGDKAMHEVGDSIKGEKTHAPNSAETVQSYLEKNFPGRGGEMLARLQSSALEASVKKTEINPVAEV